jgi:hypothetical protein
MSRSADECRTSYNQKYYQRHRDRLLQRQKEYYYANREERIRYQKEYQKELYASMTPEEKKVLNKIKNYRNMV